MTDLQEALARWDEAPLYDGGWQVTPMELQPVYNAARKWADLEAQVADGARVVVETQSPLTRGIFRTVVLGEGASE